MLSATEGASAPPLLAYRGRLLEGAPPVDRPAQGNLVRKLQLAAVGNAAGDARYRNTQRFQFARQEQCRGFAVYRRRRRQDHLADAVSLDPRAQFLEGQLFGTDAVEGR